jgi:CBS domain-containing protein
MKHNRAGSVMTTDVVRAEYGTPSKEVARLLAAHRISGLPVVDEDDKVIGVISETDLLARQAATPNRTNRAVASPSPMTRGARRQAAKANARTAGRLMTEPPVTAHADAPIAEAARTMAQHQVDGCRCSTGRTCWSASSPAATCSRSSCGPTPRSATK